MQFRSRGISRAEYLRKSKLFVGFGVNCYWFPRKLPAEPSKIVIHNNVNLGTEVYFCDHDVIHHMLNNIDECVSMLPENRKFQYTTGEIEIFDNVFVGAHATLMSNIKIGPNSIIAAGSVVTKDVPENSIVAGNPARVIGKFNDYVKKNELKK